MNDFNTGQNMAKTAEDLELARTPAQLRAYFVNKAKPMIDEYIGAALGHSELKSNNSDARKETWGLLRDIINSAGNLHRIEAENTKDVIGMLKEGSISISDAKELMHMLSLQSDIEDVKKLLEKVSLLTGDN